MNARMGMGLVVGIMVVTGSAIVATAEPVHPECVGPGTNKGGLICTDTTWTKAGSPYVVTSTVLVGCGATLTIEPGVCVRFKTDKGLQVGDLFEGAGTLVARGTEEFRIIFTSNDPYTVVPPLPPDPALANPGDWARIFFTNDATDAVFDASGDYVSGCVLEHVHVDYAGAPEPEGAAITGQNCSPYLAHCSVENNSGRAIRVTSSGAGPVRIEDCVVHHSAGTGMSVDASSGRTIHIARCQIYDNAYRGIYAKSGGYLVTIEDCEIARCAATDYYGGGIYLEGGNLAAGQNHIVRGNLVENCTATCDDCKGGGIYVDTRTTLEGNIVRGNRVKARDHWSTHVYGGGIYLSPNCDISRLENNQVTGNRAFANRRARGAGIFLDDADYSTLVGNVVMDNATYFWGDWDSHGGGISLLNSTGCELRGNTVLDNRANGEASGNGGMGGGIYLESSGGSTLQWNTITGNSTSTQYGKGGGIALWNSLNCLLTDNTITGNTTSGSHADGGGVYLSQGGTGIDRGLWRNTISNNVTTGIDGDGGGVCVVDSGDMLLDSNIIIGNRAGGEGGGILFWNCARWVLRSNDVTDNTAALAGGGIYLGQSGCAQTDLAAGRCTMTDNLVARNHTASTTDNTGGIYVNNSACISFLGDPLTCTYNCICDNDGYCVYNNTPASAACNGSIDARYVKWCTEDPADIDACIYDFWDDASLGRVRYLPFVPSTSCEDYDWYARRDLSDPRLSYCPETPKTVTIQIRPPDGTTTINLEDMPPAGWAVSDISHGGVWDPGTGKVKWGPLYAPFLAEVHYTVTPPGGEDGEKCFAGTISIDGQNWGICGEKCIEKSCCPYIPADEPQPICDPDGDGSADCGDCTTCEPPSCEDHQVQMCEVSGYACAWKKDCNDDLSGMTRAAYIWKAGECYCWDEAEGNWFPADCPAPDSGCCSDVPEPSAFATAGGAATRELRTQSADRNLPDCYSPGVEFKVTITISPDGARAIALEDLPPAGWTVGPMSDNCEWSPASRKVKCGPYFEPFPAEIYYMITPTVDACGEACFAGLVSFDGINQVIGGEQCITHCPGSSDPPNCAVDARQPSLPSFVDPLHPELGCMNPAGWDTVQMTVTWNTEGITPDDFNVTVIPGGTPPSICDVTVAGQTVTVQLCSIIPAGKWTCVEHERCGDRVCIGYLPGDVNGDRTAGPVDILAVIDNLNGQIQPPYAIWQCDVDRSGVCGPADILRVIDLLNGADCYDPWLGRTLPPCPSAP